jgi:mannitol/fructose-specific phosphotransferase system IIA component (Ntr-type)
MNLAGESVHLADLLTPDRVRVPLEATDKLGVLRELTELASTNGGTGERAQDVLEAVLERESVLSTGVGFGVAIPHAQTDAIEQLTLAAGTSAAPVTFDALDGKPVRLFFLLVGPVSAGSLRIKVLSRIARLIRRRAFRERLLSAKDASEFCRLLAESEGH